MLLWREGLPTPWACHVLKVHTHLSIWGNAGIAERAGNVQRCADLSKIELAAACHPEDRQTVPLAVLGSERTDIPLVERSKGILDRITTPSQSDETLIGKPHG